ncbi:hypothetical protein Cantr_09886 [Candida viswanathii]|uniref:Uncharacterized protein n=1 Tax=Candida viswanathii TaxID=5486 RepID=A0A367YBT3_9ASCO|nr:hypothetical protein Cantr_09886 [Candida viswanathii]
MSDYGGLGIVLEESENSISNLSNQIKQQLQQKRTSLSSSRQSSVVSLSKTISQKPSATSLYNSPSTSTSLNNDYTEEQIVVEEETQGVDDDEDDDDLRHEHFEPPRLNHQTAGTTTESLLPPLPDAVEDLTSPPAFSSSTTHYEDSLSTSTDNDSNHSNINVGDLYQHSKSSFSNYALDSPTLLLDQQNALQRFPSLGKAAAGADSLSSSSTTTNTLTSTVTANTTLVANHLSAVPSANERTSPLKRLKNGIRKLSLSSNTNSNNSSSCSTPTAPKFNPLSPPSSVINGSAAVTTTAPLNPMPLRPILSPIQVVKPMTSASHQSNQHQLPLHSASSSTSTNSSFSSQIERARALSQGTTIFTPVTPPVASPVITIGDDLNNGKKTLSKIEQSYFDSNQINSLDDLITVEDLLNYLQFLIQQRTILDDVFQKTKEKLQASGWCSDHDLHNLQLQQDSSRCQIDTSLLKIEERLNREFSCSVLGNDGQGQTVTVAKRNQKVTIATPTTSHHSKQSSLLGDEKDSTISPSLKVLESRCISFTNF